MSSSYKCIELSMGSSLVIQHKWDSYVQPRFLRIFCQLEQILFIRRVHVSESTKEALKGAYETEPGHGGDRDSYLDKAGMDTFLIVEKVVLFCIQWIFSKGASLM